MLNPFHGFNFSPADISSIPVVALPVLDDIVPLTRSRMHMSWASGNSTEVFAKATKHIDVRARRNVQRATKRIVA